MRVGSGCAMPAKRVHCAVDECSIGLGEQRIVECRVLKDVNLSECRGAIER